MGDLPVAVDGDIHAEVDTRQRGDPPHAVMNRVALGDPPARVRMPDHLGVVQPHDGLEPRQPRRDHLGAAAEPGKEVRLDEPGRHPHVGLDPRAVQPHRDPALDLPQRRQLRVVERVMHDDAIPVDDPRAQHFHQLVVGRRPVGATGDQDGDLVGRDMRERIQHHRQQGGARHRSRDVADRDGDRLAGGYEVSQRGGAEWTIKGLPDRARLVRQTIEIRRLDHRRPVVGELDGETGTAVGEIDQHWWTPPVRA